MVNISSERFIFLIWVYVILISISNVNSSLAAFSSFVDFDQCLARHFPPHLVYYRNSSSYTKLLNSSIQNDRFSIDDRSPLLILTPKKASQVQASIRCSKRYDFHIRVLSGGHDYEGLSFLSLNEPFVALHLLHLRSVSVDVTGSTAWVESGATIGQLYYGIALKSKTHGFPAGLCPTVGVGGHVSGGGIGTMMRKYGLASDNVVDAKLVDVHGRLLDRSSMGEDLFWAIRGGGAASFGVVLAWKFKLVPVPPIVTVFTVKRTLRENVTAMVHKWQHIGHRLHGDLFVRLLLRKWALAGGKMEVGADFNSLFLGRAKDLLPLMGRRFPELGLTLRDCQEMSWVESVMYFGGIPVGSSMEALLTKDPPYGRMPQKGKSDFVKKPINEAGLEGIWKRIEKEDMVYIILDPFGGRMSKISNTETAFPHRKGILYNIQYIVKWVDSREAKKHLDWMKEMYTYMEPYASKSPRRAYFNYKDLDLGWNYEGGRNTSFLRAKEWGLKYFAGNFKRLGLVKALVDEENFFRNEQSIPPLLVSNMGKNIY